MYFVCPVYLTCKTFLTARRKQLGIGGRGKGTGEQSAVAEGGKGVGSWIILCSRLQRAFS